MDRSYGSLYPLLSAAHAAAPFDWLRVFGRAAPVDLEIGCGNGEYLARQARAMPERNVVGLELLWGRVKKTLRKIAIAEAPNARVVFGNVHVVLDRLIVPGSLASACALFPCPWSARAADRRRLFDTGFLRLLNSRLAPDGTVFVVTDDRPFFDWMLEQVPGTGFAPSTAEVGPDYATKFERKWHAAGQTTFFRLDLAKTEAVHVPLAEVPTMRTHLVASLDPARFRPVDRLDGPIRVRVKRLLYDPVQAVGMVHVIVIEDNLNQDLWIEIVPAAGGWRIQPARGCHAVMSDGVQQALDLVLQAVEGAAGA